MNENYELIDNKEQHRYEFHIDNYIPLIEYTKTKNGEIYLIHTEVPEALEGKGIGSRLVKEVLADIKQKGLRLVPLCSFIASYIQKHPEWKSIVLKNVLPAL